MRQVRAAAAVVALLLPGGAITAETLDPAFLVGDRFLYERIRLDAQGGELERTAVAWEVLASDSAGHRLRITEGSGGDSSATEWVFDRDNNVLFQQIGHCRLVSEPHSGRYAWPMAEGSDWSAAYEIAEICDDDPQARSPKAACTLVAEVVATGTWQVMGIENPAIAIQRVVTCADPGNPGAVALRWEKEFLCPDLAVRCFFEYDWVVLQPGQAAGDRLAAYHDAPESQEYDGRVSETLIDIILQ